MEIKWIDKNFNYFKDRGTYICIHPEAYSDGVNFLVQILTPDSNSPTLYNEKLSTGAWGDNGEFKTWDEAMKFGLGKANELYKGMEN